jgi:heme iron utilization protein
MENFADLSDLVKKVLNTQRFAVLSTQSEGQPYTNLIAFAETENLNTLIFVTNKNTRKYANSLLNKKVAVLVDNRTNQESDIAGAVAVTAIGKIEEAAASNLKPLSVIYLAKQSQLKDFLNKPSNALMKISVTEYIVATFDSVRHLPVQNHK